VHAREHKVRAEREGHAQKQTQAAANSNNTHIRTGLSHHHHHKQTLKLRRQTQLRQFFAGAPKPHLRLQVLQLKPVHPAEQEHAQLLVWKPLTHAGLVAIDAAQEARRLHVGP
jgi:hypothetical protein